MRLSLFAVAPHGGWRKVVPDSSQPLGLEQKAFGFDGAAKPVGELEKVSALAEILTPSIQRQP
jgi:hypothetical protein